MPSCQLILFVLILYFNGSFSDLIAKRAYLSSKRDAVGGIRVDDRFYFAGGFEYNDYVATDIVDVYNITSGEWEEPLRLEEPRGFISTAVIGDNVYFIGGTRQLNCTALYDTTLHMYLHIGCGPTVRKPVQVANHNSMVTALGSFSADFYDVVSGTWSYFPNLTTWMQSTVSGITLVHENLIISIGGVNSTTLDPIYDGWIFDITTEELTVYKNVITVKLILPLSINYEVANGKLVIMHSNGQSDRIIVYQFGTNEWREKFISLPQRAAILPDVIFVFSASGYNVYNWTSNEATWTEWFTTEPNTHILTFDNQVVLVKGEQLRIYQAGQWTERIISASVTMTARWNDKYILYAHAANLRIYFSTTMTVQTMAPTLSDVSSIVPFDTNRVVFFFTDKYASIYSYSTDVLSARQPINMLGGVRVGTDIIEFSSRSVWINLVDKLTVANFNLALPGGILHDNIAIAPSFSPIDYTYIEVYNYVTRQWQDKINMNTTLSFGYYFAPVVALGDMLVVTRRIQVLRFNTTSGVATKESIPTLPFLESDNKVAEVNGVGYLPGIRPSTRVALMSNATTTEDRFGFTEQTTQFIPTKDNITFIASKEGLSTYNIIFTHDIARDVYATFRLPTTQTRLTIAVVNDTLVALGSDGKIYVKKVNDLTGWPSYPFTYEFTPRIIETMDDGTIMLAGGKHYAHRFFTDEILFLAVTNYSAVVEQQPEPVADPVASPVVGEKLIGGLTEGAFIAAIVVPVAVAAGATALIVILIQQCKKKKKSSSSNSLGLESRYGSWFTPFEQISFGEQLGQGGSGQVFKGTWKNTTVALKVSMTQANQSVIRELELMMQLRPHPNIVQLLGFSVHPETDSIILIIEFCEGGSLDKKLYDGEVEISLQTSVQWLTGIAKGLNHLHSNNVIHRDVAARNVLIHRNEPKLTDFGMSRIVDEQKQHGTTKSELGPIRWMSPESLKSKEYSVKSGKLHV
jgi:hypothetical protein